MLKKEHSSFAARLEQLLEGRKPYPWGQALGISRGSINRMLQGEPPGPELLIPIQRAENVSLSWLLDGQGAPYMVTRCHDDGECAMLLAQWLEEDWACWWLDSGITRALVLRLPAMMTVKGMPVAYHALEVLSGPLGTLCQKLLQGRETRRLHLASNVLEALDAGQIGAWQMFGDDGLLHAPPITDDAVWNVDADNPVYQTGLTREEGKLLEAWRAWPEEKRAALLALLQP